MFDGALDVTSSYEDDGFVIVRNVIDAALAHTAREHIDWLLERNPERLPDQLTHDLARADPFWYRLASDPRLLDLAEEFIGPNIALFATHYICKRPGSDRMVPWHQDGAYWPLDPMNVVTLWLAVTPSTLANGCMKVLPGSHRNPLLEMAPAGDDGVLPLELVERIDERSAVAIELNPGDVSVHHPHLVHGSPPNSSADWRCGLTLRYIPTDTRILDQAAASPFLLRGDGVPGVNEYLPEPSPDPQQTFAVARPDHT